MKVFKIKINQFIDDHQPGWVECSFFDALGKEHIARDKVPIFTVEHLDSNSKYPKEGLVGCEIMKTWKNKKKQTVYTVSSSIWGVETIEGLTEFDLFAAQLTDLAR